MTTNSLKLVVYQSWEITFSPTCSTCKTESQAGRVELLVDKMEGIWQHLKTCSILDFFLA